MMLLIDWIVIILNISLALLMRLIAQRAPHPTSRQVCLAAAVMFVLFAFRPIVNTYSNTREYVFWMLMTAILLLYMAALLVRLARTLREPSVLESDP